MLNIKHFLRVVTIWSLLVEWFVMNQIQDKPPIKILCATRGITNKSTTNLQTSVLLLNERVLLVFSSWWLWSLKLERVPPIHHPSKILKRLSKTMHSAASLKKKERLYPSPCMQHCQRFNINLLKVNVKVIRIYHFYVASINNYFDSLTPIWINF